MTLPPPLDWREAGIGPGPDVPAERRVTRANWRTWPYTRWAFQHARELVPSVALPGGSPRALPERPVDLGWNAFLAETYTDAALVLHRGAIVYERYFNGMTPATPHMAFSITKSIAGIVAERLIDAGRLDAEAKVEALLPELAASGFADATVRQVLDMTDGAAFDEDYANPDAEVHRYSAAYWGDSTEGVLGALPMLTRRSAAPGAQFRYRTAAADVLAHLLRRATGERLAALVAREVWQPSGCGDEAHMLVDTSGLEMAGTGLNATARDLARVGLWLIEERRLLAGLAEGGDRALFDAAYGEVRPGGSYRSLWWIDHDSGLIAANGVFGQRLWIDPAAELVVVKLGSHPVTSNGFTEALHRAQFARLRETLG
ncbi:serine hydrolase [Sphingomonas sp.]|uniref:serine hydrolase domain-containing protein n=1 Tax=Sphingomonas sp. TaxID=28214 RepID=UPI001B167C77|nr:serine hydrolase [Sphingomonas sp.]MBO9711689.1 serine hydrolase [Sphingomonas sp.]